MADELGVEPRAFRQEWLESLNHDVIVGLNDAQVWATISLLFVSDFIFCLGPGRSYRPGLFFFPHLSSRSMSALEPFLNRAEKATQAHIAAAISNGFELRTRKIRHRWLADRYRVNTLLSIGLDHCQVVRIQWSRLNRQQLGHHSESAPL